MLYLGVFPSSLLADGTPRELQPRTAVVSKGLSWLKGQQKHGTPARHF